MPDGTLDEHEAWPEEARFEEDGARFEEEAPPEEHGAWPGEHEHNDAWPAQRAARPEERESEDFARPHVGAESDGKEVPDDPNGSAERDGEDDGTPDHISRAASHTDGSNGHTGGSASYTTGAVDPTGEPGGVGLPPIGSEGGKVAVRAAGEAPQTHGSQAGVAQARAAVAGWSG